MKQKWEINEKVAISVNNLKKKKKTYLSIYTINNRIPDFVFNILRTLTQILYLSRISLFVR